MIWLKRALVLLALAVVLYLFWPLLGELRQAVSLFQQVYWGWLIAALVIQLLSYICLTTLNYLLLTPFEGHIGFWRLLATLTAMAFIEVAVPSVGASGAILRARLLGRNGYSVEASTFSLLLEVVYLGLALGVVSLSGLSYLLRTGMLSLGQEILLGSVISLALILAGLIFWLERDWQRARRAATWLIRRWNRLMARFDRPKYPEEKGLARLDNFYGGLLRVNPRLRGLYLLAAASRVMLDVASLGACFVAFGHLISPGILLTGYGLMMLLSGLAALPGGLGLADVSMAVIYARLGAPGAVALAVTLTYRLIAFWLLRFIGFISWQVLEARP